ncbi:hypothetical protein ACHAXS_008411 [Conticribra weissflogii]
MTPSTMSLTSCPRLACLALSLLLLSFVPSPSPWNTYVEAIAPSSSSHGMFLFANAAAAAAAIENNAANDIPIVISESNTEDSPNDDDATDGDSSSQGGDDSNHEGHGARAADDPSNQRSSSDGNNNYKSNNDNDNNGNGNGNDNLLPNDPTLTPDSVVLITGAAGFLGSELALALRRAYGVRKLLLVDHLGIPSASEGQYVPPSPADREAQNRGANAAVYETLTEEELSLFEYKRQRAFRLFHELTSPVAATSPYRDGEEGEPTGHSIHDAESMRFYRADMRPSIPEFFDFGEVPLLEGIFQSHPDITHVVHLADVPESVNQAVPRSKDSVKAGRMEGMLEELRLLLERRKREVEESGYVGNGGGVGGGSGGGWNGVAATLPHFVYASSADVYDVVSTAEGSGQPNPPPFREDKPITTPSTLRGAAKLIDEVLASAYHSTHGIYSVGLRFFPVYGPWATPGTEVFDLVERVIAENDGQEAKEQSNAAGSDASTTSTASIHSDRENVYDGDTKDYVFIDDAVDAILSAMQFRPHGSDPPPVIFNVGTGQGSTLHDLYLQLISHFPKLSGATSSRRPTSSLPHFSQRLSTKSIASTHRSELHLGFRPQTTLAEGLAHTLTWHRDRTFPYGRDPDALESFHQQGMDAAITHSLEASRGENGRCSPLDRECLRGAPVFPCASECRRTDRCTPSVWDDVAVLSKMVTTGCDAVLYTILLDDEAEKIPSASTAIGTDSMPYVGAGLPADIGAKTQVRCNIAFVSEASPLVQRLKAEGEEYLEQEESGLPPLLRHGFWTVLPVKTPPFVGKDGGSATSPTWLHAFAGTFALEYLPKVSPARFFGSSVRYAVYADSNMIIDNIPQLLKKMEDGPPAKNGSTSLLLAEKKVDCDPIQRGSKCEWTRLSKNDSIQSGVYNMVRVALRGEILGGSLHPVIDSSFLIHSLREEESRLFRCDAYSEAAQWGASGDERSLEFILSLHDLWSRAVSHWAGETPWWRNYSSAGTTGQEEEGSANSVVGEDGNGGNIDDRRSSEGSRGTFFGVLSTGETQYFTQIVPYESLGAILLDGYHRQ